MLCKNCGKEIPETAGVCLFCGAACNVEAPTAQDAMENGQLKCAHCGYIGVPVTEPILRPIDWTIGILFFLVGGELYLLFTYLHRKKKAAVPHCPICKKAFAEADVKQAGFVVDKKQAAQQSKDNLKDLANNKELHRAVLKGARDIAHSAKGLHDTMHL